MIKLLIVEDHAIVRDGLKQIFADTADIEVQGEAANGQEALQQVRQEDWDIVLLDMSIPGKSGIELIKQLRLEKPRLRILVLTMHEEQQYVARAFKAGVSGYLTKDSASAQLVSAVRKIAGGGTYISPQLAENMALFLVADITTLPHTLLSDREYQIFELLVSGKSLTDIAEQLCISIKTVSTHKSRLLEKMQMTTQTELIRYALEHRLLETSKSMEG